MKYEIIVELQKEVLDPQARAIEDAIQEQGFKSLKKITLSKRYLLEIEEDSTAPLLQAQKIASSFLANPISETFIINRLEDD